MENHTGMETLPSAHDMSPSPRAVRRSHMCLSHAQHTHTHSVFAQRTENFDRRTSANDSIFLTLICVECK